MKWIFYVISFAWLALGIFLDNNGHLTISVIFFIAYASEEIQEKIEGARCTQN